MQHESSGRVEAIRSRVREERAALSRLDASLTNPQFLELTKIAAHLLDDVEGFFLDARIVEERRTPQAFDWWLSQAEKVLGSAIRQREYVDSILAMFGPNARLIGG